MKIAVCMSHGHVAKWLQVSVYSLKEKHNKVESDIFIAETWPGHASIKAITKNDLGDKINYVPCSLRQHSHATGLDQILDVLIDRDEYDYMFCMETDCLAVRDGWLDWYLSYMKDDVGMAGFFWKEGDAHHNINPSGTLYRMDILKKYHKEVRANKDNIFWHPKGNKYGNTVGMDPTIKDVAGVFSETRGFKYPTERQKELMLKGAAPNTAWFEPGAWLFLRSVGEYEYIPLPCDHIYGVYGKRHQAPEGTFYGGSSNPYFIHFWGGTRTYDFLKHPINDTFVRECAPDWLAREDRIWKSEVPQRYHQIVYDIEKEIDVEGMMKKNLYGEGN